MAHFSLLLMLSGDIEVNPGPKTKTSQRTAKSKFKSDFNTDASIAPKQLAMKYHVSIQTVLRWLKDHLCYDYK